MGNDAENLRGSDFVAALPDADAIRAAILEAINEGARDADTITEVVEAITHYTGSIINHGTGMFCRGEIARSNDPAEPGLQLTDKGRARLGEMRAGTARSHPS